MKPNCPSRPIASARVQDGVALVMTLILLAVITFLAVAFLVLSQRERNATTSATEATMARMAADSALERAKAELIARILGTTNIYNQGLIVATNFVNWRGFDVNDTSQNATNVNFFYTTNGNPLTPAQLLQNIANLQFDPPVPVVYTNRYFANSNEARFYLDLNRNGRYDQNGYWPVIFVDTNNPGMYVYYDTNGFSYPYPGPVPQYPVSAHIKGDPEWRGILPRPDDFHGPNNRFGSRYTFLIIPAGNTLDINYIHNHAKRSPGTSDGFYRNEGVGPWEINLAAFLVDLNTNMWFRPPPLGYGISFGNTPYYRYTTNTTLANEGAAFQDAFELIDYRYMKQNYNTYDGNPTDPRLARATVFNLYGNVGQQAVRRDWVDWYSSGPLLTDYRGLVYQPNVTIDPDFNQTQQYWAGGYFPQHFFSTQDFFDRSKLSYARQGIPGFDVVDRLSMAGTNLDTYNSTTFMRMIEQMGTDSAPDPSSKINLNYANLPGLAATNFLDWNDPIITNKFGASGGLLFFTNAAERLLTLSTREWRGENQQAYEATFGTKSTFGVTEIPVLMSNRFVYTPSVHRLLQLAANIHDALNNTPLSNLTPTNQFPSVFRPVFEKRNGTNLVITGFEEVGPITASSSSTTGPLSPPRDITNPTEFAALVTGTGGDNIYGVPWIVGAKKGLPNFNEVSMRSVVEVTRKLQVARKTLNDPQTSWRTNMMYVVGISNIVGIEAWNSYKTAYPRDINIGILNSTTMSLTGLVNNTVIHRRTSTTNLTQPALINAQTWVGFKTDNPQNTNNLRILLQTNLIFQPDLAYDFSLNQFTGNTNNAWIDIKRANCPQPQWIWGATNRMRLIMLDRQTGRVLDYVQLGGPTAAFDAGYESQKPLANKPPAYANLWGTNRVNGPNGLPEGVRNQILVSLGDATAGGSSAAGGAPDDQDWSKYGLGNAAGAFKYLEIAKFRALYGISDPNYPGTVNTNLISQVPFSPTARISQYVTWQANDPLVHYTAGDLQYLLRSNDVGRIEMTDVPGLDNLGRVNDRYEPWGGSPVTGQGSSTSGQNTFYSLKVKDPLVKSSDAWFFPTNKLPSIGWLGRIHRGTPWQTVYMKSTDVSTVLTPTTPNEWQQWSGNPDFYDAMRTRPVRDWALFDVFTTAVGDNASRGQMSINQSGMAAWSAILSGVVALTNATADNLTFADKPPVYRVASDPALEPFTYYIQPVGTYGDNVTNSPLYRIWKGINDTRNGTNFGFNGSFRHLGDILATPQLTTASPFLRTNTTQIQNGINDAACEWLPQQIMGLLRVGEPRFVVYAYGQSLKPADAKSIVAGGPYDGMCTNYQVTAEVCTRAVLRVEGSPNPSSSDYPPRIVVESFNIVPSD